MFCPSGSCCSKVCVLFVFLFIPWSSSHEDVVDSKTLIRRLENENLLIISTLDGSLLGVERLTGDLRWKVDNEPTVKVPINTENAIIPIFLPDPKDGSLYLFNSGDSNVLKKLPFSIQQLVASSPCKSTDGIFYSGKKIDSWISIDWKTGKKTSLIDFNNVERTCPLQTSDSLFVGRTEYKVLMFDSKSSKRHWNITFFDYSSQKLSTEQLAYYSFIHAGSTASGLVRTWDRTTGSVLWEKDYGSPMVALYTRLGQDIVELPFSLFAQKTFSSLPYYDLNDKFHNTLYIGEHGHGLYALPSFVGPDVPVLTDSAYANPLLLEGPNEKGSSAHPVILGHYFLPEIVKTQLQITGRSDPIIPLHNNTLRNANKRTLKPTHDTPKSQISGPVFDSSTAVIVCFLLISIILLYLCIQVRDIKHSSRGSSNGLLLRTNDQFTSQEGDILVGKISFNTKHVLGKGCEGTFVFKGRFDGRSVAVKRLLPDCFTVADREVKLLRESDDHPNVIRYFSMEEDSQFRYIALELCSATLQDYVEKGLHKEEIDALEILKQASIGLEHLHSLNIVHRDIKPHNILLCANGSLPQIRAMISDFGLCKKLPHGKASFSRKSGITGTEGWMAPEVLETNGRIMCAVDVFSLGCVFYYTLNNGKHPFGEPLKRQMNILSGEYRLNFIASELWRTLIEKMISQDPIERPNMSVVSQFPVFWEKKYILTFLQDVSDRCEKEGVESEALQSLETGGVDVCEGDWKAKVHPQVAFDLGKYRSYRGDSVRDLLRALRNKKHHYRELPAEAQALLGYSPENYVSYWLSRFPSLVYHTWISLQCLKEEPNFSSYYPKDFTFPCCKSPDLPEWFHTLNSKEKAKPRSPQKGKWAKGKEDMIKVDQEMSNWRSSPIHFRRKDKKNVEAESIVWTLPTK